MASQNPKYKRKPVCRSRRFIAVAVEAWLELLGMKQKDFARFCGISTMEMSHILTGRGELRTDTLHALGMAFGGWMALRLASFEERFPESVPVISPV